MFITRKELEGLRAAIKALRLEMTVLAVLAGNSGPNELKEKVDLILDHLNLELVDTPSIPPKTIIRKRKKK